MVDVHVWVTAKVPVVWVELLSIVRRREWTVDRLTVDDEGPAADGRSVCGGRWDEWGSRICWEPVHDEGRCGVARIWVCGRRRRRIEGWMVFTPWHPVHHHGRTWERGDVLVSERRTTKPWIGTIATSVADRAASLRPAAEPPALAVAVARGHLCGGWSSSATRHSWTLVQVELSHEENVVFREKLEWVLVVDAERYS